MFVVLRLLRSLRVALVEFWEELDDAINRGACETFFESTLVSEEIAAQCLYLCEFYFHNTIPFLEIVSEQDKLSGERKLVELLVNKYGGRAKHSELMNASHMKKREFREAIESLIEREAMIVEAVQTQTKTARMYVLNREIIDSWNAG